MCGQVGIIFGRKRRRPDERDYLRGVFIRMLLHSEERGPHASGLAWLKTDGSHRIFKRPMRAHELVYEKPFQELLGQVDNETTILMGHTRWRTRGNEFNNRNNHPIRAGIVIGTHNGTIYNADYLFRRLGLPRYAEVDSELIFRLADRFAPEGSIDQEGLKKALALCRGQMSAVLVSRLDPGTITVLKGNKSLCLRIHRQHRVVLYASDDAFIDFAVDKEKGWRELEVPPMTMLTIRHEDVRAVENSEFRFIPQERKGTLPEGVNA
jgi:glucosamine 6-phosphate synthetase-like amidotransferase/phosphosugar isomerase protein